ncbi:adenosylcobinamide-GDP ribazoletransferase [Phreatobacter stygius]|uniref:Adenosylcobinamide-GDP ribazoletransferase n=1 Tax=Phreatobacter stygius TaxID=1940610 RepID=A0A4D7B6M9_9HYPH|nr:adenosylcobinamide-GDP ribazoletransferase [Phreatobacter stygius]QCI66613.1 adenosylcobinamide-GDP ribazoletransferase [Phreatobacter stygius]
MTDPKLWRDTVQALRFFSRLPLPALSGEADPHGLPDFAELARVVPLVGLVLGGMTGLVLLPASLVWPPMVAALVCVGAGVVMTGAFHEDGLADTADSLGGVTPERRLEIMKDSRIGTFGAAALIIGLLLKVTAIASLVGAAGAGRTALALAAAGAVSRMAAMALSYYLPAARPDGAASATGTPSPAAWQAGCLTALATGLLAWPAAGFTGVLLGLAAAAGLAGLAVRFARAHIGGHTGDVAGATQQCVEIAVLLVWLIFA